MSDRDQPMDHTDDEDHGHEGERVVPRRRRARACDNCRRRKVKCDGSEDAEQRCSTCRAFGDKCTYSPSKRRHADENYIKHLESEVVRLQFLVQQLEAKLKEKEGTDIVTTPSRSTPSAAGSPPKVEDDEEDSVLEGFRFMTLNDMRHVHYMGRSSYIGLINTAISMKREVTADGNSELPNVFNGPMVLSRLRPQFWLHLSGLLGPDPPYTDFPDPNRMSELLENYFRKIHPTFPLLHGPTFLHGVASGLHLDDESFGAVLLLVCALGARFATDPAKLPPGVSSWQLEGWCWFDQVRTRRKLMPITKTTLYDLQVTVLSGAYVASLGLPYTNFALVGYGLRLAQDLGAHRRTTYENPPTVEDELKRRAFWCLVAMDRAMCTVLGRPCAIQDEDFDVDYPTECDDEYWTAENPEAAFRQPFGKPSTVTHFVWYLKLLRINAHALRTIYSLQANKLLQDPENAQQIIADLDSDLNDWADTLPESIRYDPHRADMPFATQAASLQAVYHNLRIFVHRPFITTPRKIAMPFPSFTICTTAARACIQVLERYFALSGPVLLYHYHIGSLFQAGIIMLLHVWQSIRNGTAGDATQELELVSRALRVLKSLESHWDVSGRFWDILSDLLTAVQARLGDNGRDDASSYQGSVDSGMIYSGPTPQAQRHPGTRTGTHLYLSEPIQASSSSDTEGYFAPPHQLFSNANLVPDGNPGGANPSLWQGAIASTGAGVQPYDVFQNSDPDLDAIFANLLPTMPYNVSMFGGAEPFSAGQAYSGGEGGYEPGQYEGYGWEGPAGPG